MDQAAAAAIGTHMKLGEGQQILSLTKAPSTTYEPRRETLTSSTPKARHQGPLTWDGL